MIEKFGIEFVAILDKFKNKMNEMKNMGKEASDTIQKNFQQKKIKTIIDASEVKNIAKSLKEVDLQTIKQEQTETELAIRRTIKEIEDMKAIIEGINPNTNAYKSLFNEITRAEAELEKLKQKKEEMSSTEIKVNLDDMDAVTKVAYLKEQIKELKKELSQTDPTSKKFSEVANAINNYENKLRSLSNTQKNTKKSTKDLDNSVHSSGLKFKTLSSMLKGTKPEMSAVMSGVEKLANKMKSSFKKMVLAIVGVRSAFFAMRKAVSSYMAFDEELTKTLQSSWAGLGAQLAPIIEYVVNLFAKLVAYINGLIRALTGLNMIARANAKALNAQAKAGKEASKSLTALDEITNISDNSGAGDDNTIKLPEAPLDDFLKLFLEKIRIGDWYEAGKLLAEKINDTLKSINWDKIKKTAGDIGKNIALFLNGGIENTDWKLIGNTLAEGLNTAFNFLYKFITTFNFSAFGKGIADTINGFFKKTNWKKIGKTIQNAISGVLDFGRAFFENIDVDLIADSLDEIFSSINWDKFWEKWYQLNLTMSPKINWFVARLLWIILKAIIESFISWITIFTKYGFKMAEALIKGLANGIADKLFGFIQWLNDKFNEVIEAIRKKLGIHSPSTVMYQIGEDLIQGLINGIGNIWDKVKVKFEEFKTKMTDKINEISNIKFEITAKLKANVDEFKKKISKAFSNNDVISGVLNWGTSKINQVRNWINSLDTGTGYVPEDQMAYIHKGEAVIPKKFNSAEYFSNINDNTETNNLLLEANRTLIDILEKPSTFEVNGKELARTTYNDFQEEGKRLGQTSVVKVR